MNERGTMIADLRSILRRLRPGAARPDRVSMVGDAAPGYPIRHADAVGAVTCAHDALERGDAEEAASHAFMAVCRDPGWVGGYHSLAQALQASGRSAQAASAWMGLLHTDTLDALLPSRAAREPGREPVARRHVCFGPSRVTVPPPLFEGTRQRLDPLEVVSEGCWIDRVVSGRVWQDTSNTLVMDASGNAIPSHSKRNAELAARLASDREPLHVPGRIFVLGAPGTGNFYHWMLDVLPKLALVRRAGLNPGPGDRVVIPIGQQRFQTESLSALGIEESQLLITTASSVWLSADEVVVPRIDNRMGYAMGKEIPRLLRGLFERTPAVEPRGPGRRLYVDRKERRAKGRLVTNRTDVEDVLRRHEVETVYPEELERARMHNRRRVADFSIDPKWLASAIDFVDRSDGRTGAEPYADAA